MFHRFLLLVFFFSPSFLSQVQSTIVQENFQSFDEELINIGATEENDIGQESKQNEGKAKLYHTLDNILHFWCITFGDNSKL